jgi:uncharacterized protein (DUF4415 family)
MPRLKPGTVIPSTLEDEAIIEAALDDPDALPTTEAEWEAARPVMRIGRTGRPAYTAPKKAPVTLRLDVDVLAALKATGRGWQTRVNDAMRDWLKTHSA